MNYLSIINNNNYELSLNQSYTTLNHNKDKRNKIYLI